MLMVWVANSMQYVRVLSFFLRGLLKIDLVDL